MPKILTRPLNFMLESSISVDQICSPLIKLGITFFSYTKIYKDGSRIDINNNPRASKNYYENEKYLNAAMESDPFEITDKYLLWHVMFPEDEPFKVFRDNFNIDYGITIVNKYEKFCELSHFATFKNNYSILNFYLNNLDILKTFIVYFKDKAQDLIRNFEVNKIKIITNENDSKENELISRLEFNSNVREEFINSLDIKKFYLVDNNKEIYLTKREAECFYWCVRGKSASETASILNISQRTVEAYISKIKLKLDCIKQSQLVSNYHKMGIGDSFFYKK